MTGWAVIQDGETLTLARPGRTRLDFAASAVVSGGPIARRRLAHQIRQDLWRRLQSLRGFSPVVEVTGRLGEIRVRAGGQVDGACPATAISAAEETLACPQRLARWLRHARARG